MLQLLMPKLCLFPASHNVFILRLTLEMLRLYPHNESAWNYLHGFECDKHLDLIFRIVSASGRTLASFASVVELCQQLAQEDPPSPFALSTLAVVYEQQLEVSIFWTHV